MFVSCQGWVPARRSHDVRELSLCRKTCHTLGKVGHVSTEIASAPHIRGQAFSSNSSMNSNTQVGKEETPEVLFSDIDGTLVHYPKEFLEYAEIVSEDEQKATATIRYKESKEERECVIMSSLTGGKSYMSKLSLDLIARLGDLGVCFVLITGARTSTYIKRRPLLPEANFEFFENGGRKLQDGVLDPTWTDCLSAATGPIPDRVNLLPTLPPPEERSGTLWDLYRKMKADGWTLDAQNYTTNFRVKVSGDKTADEFQKSVVPLLKPKGLATSFNLGKADIYPDGSGKANAARHILNIKEWDARQAVALFDDDNDLELGALCGRSFLPGVTHPNVLNALQKHASWTLTTNRGFLGTEEALRAIIALREGSSMTGSTSAHAQRQGVHAEQDIRSKG